VQKPLCACSVIYSFCCSRVNCSKWWTTSIKVAVNKASSIITAVPFGMFLVAKAPYPPLGEGQTSKNSVLKRTSVAYLGSTEGESEEEEEKGLEVVKQEEMVVVVEAIEES
jgi:hypothetical protein